MQLSVILVVLALLWPQADGAARRAAAEQTWAHFPAFVWRQDYFGREPPEDWESPFEGTNVERDRDEAWVFARGVDFYVGHGPGRDTLFLDRDSPDYAATRRRWIESRELADLKRVPCLTDPETIAGLSEQLERTLRARDGRHGIGISLGDEVSLTPWGDPLDLCRSPTCEEAWLAWWRRQQEAGPAPQTGTDAVRVAVLDGHTDAIGPWLSRRRFHREVLLTRLTELAQQLHTGSPGTGVGLLGIFGTSTFGGVAIDRILPQLDFAEAYATGETRELLFTLRGPEQRALATILPESGLPAAGAWQLWEHWLRGGDGVVIWSDRQLTGRPPYRARLAQALRELRALREGIPSFRPAPSGAALVTCPDSVAASWLRDALLDGPTWPERLQGLQEEIGTRERDLRAWLRLLEDCGVLPGALPLDQVGRGTVQRFPLLVLNHLLVVDPEDQQRLADYLRAGGHLVVRGELGWIDAHGQRPDPPVPTRLREIAGDRVHDAPPALGDYPALRLDGTGSTARRLREATLALLSEAGLSPRPWRVIGAGARLPWLSASVPLDGGGRLCAILPNLSRPEDRGRHLEDLALEIAVEAPWRLRWLHPVEGPPRVLRAGDAAVFALEPR